MTQSDFFNFRSFSSQLNTAKNTVCWTQIRQVDVLKDSSNMLQYKYSFDEEPKQIMLYKNEITHPRARKKFKFPDNIPICYTEQLPISKEKLNDLRFFRDRNYIPRLYHSFYDKLTCNNHLPEDQIDSD